MLQDGIDRATRVVRQLLVLERVGSNAVEARTAPVDLLALAEDVVTQHVDAAVQKGIDLGVTRGESVTVSGNAENLGILLENLLDNALRYTPANGKVNVSVYADGGDAVVEIQDSGIGIPVSERKRIFERFHRVLGTEVEGTGLGLSIAQDIVEQHGGSIGVGDGLGDEGANFTIRLPTGGESRA